MFEFAQPHTRETNRELISASFKLRKRVFHDRLGWSVNVEGEEERDAYDDLDASYLLWHDERRTKLYGCVRLMPTTGPTLLHDVFSKTHNNNNQLIDPSIWEGTRMCIDEGLVVEDFPELSPSKAFAMLLLALCETALSHKINRLVSNYEAYMKRIYLRAGLTFECHGHADEYGARAVYCASFIVSQTALARMRARLGIKLPLYAQMSTHPVSRVPKPRSRGLAVCSPELAVA